MKIALIHNPYYHQEHMENLEFVSNNFGTFPPLGLMYVSSILKDNGHETEIIDIKAENLSKEEVIGKLKNFSPDYVGIMTIPFTIKISLKWAEFIKKNLNIPTITGNYAMQFYPDAIVSRNFIDYGIIGSSRKTLPKLLDSLENGDDIEGIEGVVFQKDSGKVVVNEPKEKKENFEELPWPDRESINNSKYSSMASKKSPFTILVTSYGCTYKCEFCDMGKFGYSERDPKDVVDEIEYCVEKHDIKEIDIFDRDFLINGERSERICKEIIKRDLDIKWSCRTRVDQVDEEILKLMKGAGCRLILYGIESGNQEILERDHKDITLSEIRNAIELTKRVGIETLGFFIIGHPGETEENIRETIEFAKELPLDYVQFFKMSGKPGAKLWEKVEEELGYDYFEKLIKGEIKKRDTPRPWVNLTNDEIEKWVLKAYAEFYLRPSYIFNRLLKINSLSEFKRYMKVGLKLISQKIKS